MFFSWTLAGWLLPPTQPHYPEQLATVKILVILIVISQFFDTIRNVLTGAYRGMFDTIVPMLASLVSIWLIHMPLADVFCFILQQGIDEITFSNNIVMGVGGLWLWKR